MRKNPLSKIKPVFFWRAAPAALLLILPFFGFVLSLCIGRYPVSLETTLSILFSKIWTVEPAWSRIEESVILNIRQPRAITAMLVGSALAISGATFQGLFRNPLVSPGILGVTAGAGFGACIGILISGNTLVIQSIAFVTGLFAVITTYCVSHRREGSSLFMLVLSGVIVGAFFQALIGIAKTVADPEDQLPAIVYWLLGSMAGSSYDDVLWSFPPIFIGIVILISLRWHINVLSLGEEEAQALGVDPRYLRWTLIATATAVTSVSVSLCGMVGWIGLIIPHIARMLVGPDHSKLIPATVSLGAFSMVLIDDIARTATEAEIPLSILTALFGAPFFVILLRKTGGRWT